MEKVGSYFENFFDSEPITEIPYQEEIKRSKISNANSSNSDRFKKKEKFQSYNNSVYDSTNPSYKSTDPLVENNVIYTENDWREILKVNDLSHTPHLELLGSLRAGIPENLRPRIWFFLCKINELKKKHADRIYYRLKTSKSNADEDIMKDIHRTYPETSFFQNNKENQERLFNILRAYANYDSILGYTQGMNYVVASMLIIIHPSNYDSLEDSFGSKDFSYEEYEEKVFWILIFIAYKINWREVYRDGMMKTHDLLSFFKKKMIHEIPDIYNHILSQGLNLQMCFDHAFITILLYFTPIEFSKRIIDLFLLKGEHIIFDILIRMMILSRSHILSLNSTEELFNYIRKTMIAECFEKNSAKDYVKILLPFPQVESINF